MDLEKEFVVLTSIYFSRTIHNRSHLRLSEISKISGVKISTLQRMLKRFEHRGWVQKIKTASHSDEMPIGSIGDMIPLRKINSKGMHKAVFIPEEALSEFRREVQKLKRKRRLSTFDQFDKSELYDETESYDEALSNQYSRKKKFLEFGMSFNGSISLWRKILKKYFPTKKYTFYRLVEYPYHYRIRGGLVHDNKDRKTIPKWNNPKQTTRFWKNAAKDLKQLEREWKDIIPRTTLLPRSIQGKIDV